MMHNSFMLLKKKLISDGQQLIDSVRQQVQDVFENDGKLQMVETRLYIGLNDADTKKTDT